MVDELIESRRHENGFDFLCGEVESDYRVFKRQHCERPSRHGRESTTHCAGQILTNFEHSSGYPRRLCNPHKEEHTEPGLGNKSKLGRVNMDKSSRRQCPFSQQYREIIPV